MSAARNYQQRTARVVQMDAADTMLLSDSQRDIEKAVLGSMILDAEQIITWRTIGAAQPNAGHVLFRFPMHRDILNAILSVSERGISADFTTVIAEMANNATLKNAGGPGYVASLEQHVFSTYNCRDHIRTLINSYRKAQAESMCVEMAERVRNGEDVNTIVTEIQDRSRKLQQVESRMYTPTVELLVDAHDRLTTSDENMTRTIPSSFATLNQMTGGYVRKQMHLVGAPTGNGKTAFVLQELDLFIQANLTVDAFLYESDLDQILSRYNSRIYGIDGRAWTTKYFNKKDRENAFAGTRAFSSVQDKLYLAPRGLHNAYDVRAMVEERKQQTGKPCDVIIIDHLGRMGASRKEYNAQSYESYSENTEQLWALAAENNAILLVADQLTTDSIRNSFNNTSKLPTTGAFKYGPQANAAKVVVILYKSNQDMLGRQQVVEQLIVVCKTNDGRSGAIPSLFIKPLTLHIEDDGTPSGRFPHKEHLHKFGYDIGTRRTDTTREES